MNFHYFFYLATLIGYTMAISGGPTPTTKTGFYIACYRSGTVMHYDANFKLIETFGPALQFASTLDFTADGNLLALGRSPAQLVELDADGNTVSSIVDARFANGIDARVDSANQVYTATQTANAAMFGLSLHDLETGQFVKTIGTRDYQSVALLPNGLIWAGGRFNEVDVFNAATHAFIETIVLDNNQVQCLTMHYSAATNTVFMADFTGTNNDDNTQPVTNDPNGRVFERNLDGSFVRVLFAADHVAGLLFSNNKLYTSEYLGNKVNVFDGSSNLIETYPLEQCDGPAAIVSDAPHPAGPGGACCGVFDGTGCSDNLGKKQCYGEYYAGGSFSSGNFCHESCASLKIVVVFTRAPSEAQTIEVRVSHPASQEQTLNLQQDESGAQTLNNVAAGTHTIEALTALNNHDVSITCVDGAGASTTTEGMSASIQLSNTDEGICTITYSPYMNLKVFVSTTPGAGAQSFSLTHNIEAPFEETFDVPVHPYNNENSVTRVYKIPLTRTTSYTVTAPTLHNGVSLGQVDSRRGTVELATGVCHHDAPTTTLEQTCNFRYGCKNKSNIVINVENSGNDKQQTFDVVAKYGRSSPATHTLDDDSNDNTYPNTLTFDPVTLYRLYYVVDFAAPDGYELTGYVCDDGIHDRHYTEQGHTYAFFDIDNRIVGGVNVECTFKFAPVTGIRITLDVVPDNIDTAVEFKIDWKRGRETFTLLDDGSDSNKFEFTPTRLGEHKLEADTPRHSVLSVVCNDSSVQRDTNEPDKVKFEIENLNDFLECTFTVELLGACCGNEVDDLCQERVTQSECLEMDSSAQWTLDAKCKHVCDSGACCLDGGDCQELLHATCASRNGSFGGSRSSCKRKSCGMCCDKGNACFDDQAKGTCARGFKFKGGRTCAQSCD